MDELATIDAEILKLEDQIRQLKRRRNTLSHLCRLPTELLIRIVALLQSEVTKPGFTVFKQHQIEYDGRWTRLMLTCSYVRGVLLEARALWSLIDCRLKTKWSNLCLERCGEMPLELTARRLMTVSITSQAPRLIVSRVGQLFPRSRTAYICLGTSNGGTFLSGPTPWMEHLHLESIFEIVLTSKFLHGSQSHLRSLVVRHVSPIDDPPSFPRLQILELDIFWVDHKDPSTMTRLIQLLQGAPCIQDLSLVRPEEPTPWSLSVWWIFHVSYFRISENYTSATLWSTF
jgi:hypothetical protein